MAKKHPITRPIIAKGGPVSSAIRAAREPVAPFFVPCGADDDMRTGWHIARRHDWTDPGRFEVVWLEVFEDTGGFRFALWRAGGAKPENPMEWAFQHRIGGFRSGAEDPLDLPATRH